MNDNITRLKVVMKFNGADVRLMIFTDTGPDYNRILYGQVFASAVQAGTAADEILAGKRSAPGVEAFLSTGR